MIRRGRFIAISPKSYFAYNADDDAKKTGFKGTQRYQGTPTFQNLLYMLLPCYHGTTLIFSGVSRVEGNKLTLQDYITVLYNHIYIEKTNRGFQFNKKSGGLSYIETKKLALNPTFCKFLVQADSITCKPLIHPDTKKLL